MEIENLYPGSWGANCYLLMTDGHAAVVDPSPSVIKLMEVIRARGVTLEKILLTHGHFDHITAIDTLRDATDAEVWIHEDDAELLTDAHKNAFYKFFQTERVWRPAEHTVKDGDVLTLGNETIKVIHTPGHTMGSVCFLLEDGRLLTGDTLFARGYGRYDLYGGNVSMLFESLAKMRELPQDLRILPGHGAEATLAAALDVYY